MIFPNMKNLMPKSSFSLFAAQTAIALLAGIVYYAL